MNQTICMNCGSPIDRAGVACSSCGFPSEKAINPKIEKLLSAAFALLRDSQFDKAKTAFEAVIRKDCENVSAYWGRLCARYQVTYVTAIDGRSIPRCATRSGANLAKDIDYRTAMAYADDKFQAFLSEQEKALKALCSVVSSMSKNITHRFTMGEVDSNDGMTGKMKNPRYTLNFSKNNDGTQSVIGVELRHKTKVVIPSAYKNTSVTGVLDSAFHGCADLTGIAIPDSVTTIGNSAFWDCNSLTSIVIPKGVVSIGDSMFYYCSSLTGIAIPDSVTTIGGWAFRGCSSLMRILFGGTKAQWKKISFGFNWNAYTGNYTVICTDGTLSKIDS